MLSVALQVASDLFARNHPFVVVIDAISEKLELSSDLGIEPGEHKCSHIILQPLFPQDELLLVG